MRAAGADGWLPYSYYQDGSGRGLGFEVARAAIQAAGQRLETPDVLPWRRQLQALEAGELDIIVAAYVTEERAKTFSLSAAYARDEVRVFTRIDRSFPFTEWSDLIGRTGGRPSGGSYGTAFDSFADANLTFEHTYGGEFLFAKLARDRLDYVVLALRDGMGQIAQSGYQGMIAPLDTPIIVNPVVMLISRRSPCTWLGDAIDAEIARRANAAG